MLKIIEGVAEEILVLIRIFKTDELVADKIANAENMLTILNEKLEEYSVKEKSPVNYNTNLQFNIEINCSIIDILILLNNILAIINGD